MIFQGSLSTEAFKKMFRLGCFSKTVRSRPFQNGVKTVPKTPFTHYIAAQEILSHHRCWREVFLTWLFKRGLPKLGLLKRSFQRGCFNEAFLTWLF